MLLLVGYIILWEAKICKILSVQESKKQDNFSVCIIFYTDPDLLQQALVHFVRKCIESIARDICYWFQLSLQELMKNWGENARCIMEWSCIKELYITVCLQMWLLLFRDPISHEFKCIEAMCWYLSIGGWRKILPTYLGILFYSTTGPRLIPICQAARKSPLLLLFSTSQLPRVR